MNKKFKLSDKVEENDEDTMEEYELSKDEKYWIYLKDVKKFIRLLKEKINKDYSNNVDMSKFDYFDIIDKLAGEKLK